MGTDTFTDDEQFNQRSNGEDTKTGSSDLSNRERDSQRTGEPAKHRGRPKGSKNKPRTVSFIIGDRNNDNDREVDNGQNDNQSTVEQTTAILQEATKKRGRKPKVVSKTIENPAEVSRLILDKLEAMATTLIGEEGKFIPHERFLLEVGLQDTVSHISPETAAKVMAIVSPVALIGGMALYGYRIALVLKYKVDEQRLQDAQFVAQQEFTNKPNTYKNSSSSEFRMSDTIVPPYTDLRTD